VYVKFRDELESTVDSVVQTATAIVLGLMSGGAATVEMALVQMARAAAASAMAKVVTKKVIMGDRFDVFGADGASAFASGAVDGAMNVIAPNISKGLNPVAQAEAMATSAAAAPKGLPKFLAGLKVSMAEGAASGAMSGGVETITNDRTWAESFDTGLRKVLTSAAGSAVQGAAMAGLIHTGTAVHGAIKGTPPKA
jgi:hypothetical protein